MDIFQVVVLALIQGITEFLPVSSSAHLILPKELFGWQDQGLAFDVAVHVGTLVAVMVYFRKDVGELLVGWLQSVFLFKRSDNAQVAWFIVLATIPAGLVGLLLGDLIETHLRSMTVIATTTILFGLVLWFADRNAGQALNLRNMTFMFALIIGLAQALALIPGTSRSGITISAALLLGFTRVDAARFSFLMSIPVILLSGGLKGISLVEADHAVDWTALFLGIAISAVSAYFCIHYFLGFINRIGMVPFVIYRLILGVALFLLVYSVV